MKSNECLPCDSNCVECSHYADKCTKCASGLILNKNECISNCPDGYYLG